MSYKMHPDGYMIEVPDAPQEKPAENARSERKTIVVLARDRAQYLDWIRDTDLPGVAVVHVIHATRREYLEGLHPRSVEFIELDGWTACVPREVINAVMRLCYLGATLHRVREQNQIPF